MTYFNKNTELNVFSPRTEGELPRRGKRSPPEGAAAKIISFSSFASGE